MTAEAFFNAARALKREMTESVAIGLSQGDVDALNAIILSWRPEANDNPTAITDSSIFFGSVRNALGALRQSQVDGFELLLQAMGGVSWALAYTSYGLATAWHETNATMEPVREAYWLSEEWRKNNLRYFPWYGRGFVQLTWKGDDKQPAYGYTRADAELDLAGALLADPDLAMKPDVAAQIMVKGMEAGWFTGKKLADYLPASGRADIHQFANARHIINGTDKDVEIAELALKFQDALSAGGWE